jgi:hypothetical protein
MIDNNINIQTKATSEIKTPENPEMRKIILNSPQTSYFCDNTIKTAKYNM